MTDTEKIEKLKEIVTNYRIYSKEEVVEEFLQASIEDVKDTFIEWNDKLNEMKEILYYD